MSGLAQGCSGSEARPHPAARPRLMLQKKKKPSTIICRTIDPNIYCWILKHLLLLFLESLFTPQSLPPSQNLHYLYTPLTRSTYSSQTLRSGEYTHVVEEYLPARGAGNPKALKSWRTRSRTHLFLLPQSRQRPFTSPAF